MNTAIANTTSPAAETITHRITEVIIPQVQQRSDILLPLIAAYSQQQQQPRWITWITSSKPSRQQLLALGTNIKRLRIIHTHSRDDNRWLVWEALNKGNSQIVVSDQCNINQSDIQRLEEAAINGHCTGVVIRQH